MIIKHLSVFSRVVRTIKEDLPSTLRRKGIKRRDDESRVVIIFSHQSIQGSVLGCSLRLGTFPGFMDSSVIVTKFKDGIVKNDR